MKEKEDLIHIIRKNEYKEDLEAQVKMHLDRIMSSENPPERITTKISPIEIPDFGSDIKAQQNWQIEEILKCQNGHTVKGIYMPGLFYYYFNHCYIKHKKRGKIRPDFRTTDLTWFRFREKISKQSGKGIVSIKRRQVGMSTKEAAAAVWNCQFHRDFEIGMTSKTERDTWGLLSKVKYTYRNQSDFLKVRTSTDRRDALLFAVYDKDQFGNKGKLIVGTESKITCVPPTDTGHAGNQYRELVIDEAGEIVNLDALFANAEDCLMVENVREGTPVFFGTMGETNTVGQMLREFWLNNTSYNLERFAFWGYNELIMDELGNDNVEESVRWIIYERKRKESGAQAIYNKFLQKYPLDEKDAFLTVSGAGVGNVQLINEQLNTLIEKPPIKHVGWFRPDISGTPIWYPDPMGKIIIYEHPKAVENGYVSAADPVDHDDVKKSRDSSNLALAILAKPFNVDPPKIVLEYVDRPKKVDEFFIQTVLALKYYNTKVLPEDNRQRMVTWFLDNGYEKLLAFSPKGVNSVKGGVEMKYGFKMTAEKKLQIMGLIDNFIANYHNFIPSVRFLKECLVFGGEHDDDDFAIAVGIALMMLQTDKTVVKNKADALAKSPNLSWRKVGNTFQLVGPQGNINSGLSAPSLPKSALFK